MSYRMRRARGPTEQLGELVDHLELPGLTETATARYDHVGLIELRLG